MTTFAARGLWLAWGLLLSLIIGILGTITAYLGGAHPATAMMTGAATFAATLTLILLVLGYLAPDASAAQHRRRRRR